MLSLTIELANGTANEALVRDTLISLRSKYDLSRWEVTDLVRIEDGAMPHSHPVLTLGTGYPHDLALFSNYVHEQMHWLVFERTSAAVEELRARYTDPPIGGPGGADTEWSTYLHYIVNFLELVAMQESLGLQRGTERVLRKPFYTTIYHSVVEDFDWMSALCGRHNLFPA